MAAGVNSVRFADEHAPSRTLDNKPQSPDPARCRLRRHGLGGIFFINGRDSFSRFKRAHDIIHARLFCN